MAARSDPPQLLLPRGVDADPAVDRIRAALRADCRPLRPGGALRVPHLPWTSAVRRVLAAARAGGAVVLGLEATVAALESEHAGLQALQARGERVGARVSRLAVLSRDASSRLAGRVERLATIHAPRLLVVVFDVAAAQLGEAVGAGDRPVKLLLLRHREAVAALLRALA